MQDDGDDVKWLDDTEMDAWRNYITGSALLEYRLNRDLQAAHGVSLADYEILVRLSDRQEHRMRMSELAAEVAHSKSRISHQIRRLERAELVERTECPSDGRGVFAVLTERGMKVLRSIAPEHVASVREHYVDLLDPEEQRVIAKVFGRLVDHLRDTES